MRRIVIGLSTLVVLLAGFAGGFRAGQVQSASSTSSTATTASIAALGTGAGGAGATGGGGFGGRGGGGAGAAGAGAGAAGGLAACPTPGATPVAGEASTVSGTVSAVNGTSVTVHDPTCNTDTTVSLAGASVTKTTAGAASDVVPSTRVTVRGTQGADGTLAARTVVVVPAGSGG